MPDRVPSGQRTADPRPAAAASGALPSPRGLYGAVALVEVITWALLLIGMAFKYTGVTEVLVSIFGTIHGVATVAYVLTSLFVWVNERWSVGVGVMALVSAVIPFATLPFERWTLRTGRLSAAWRLAPGSGGGTAEAPRGLVERLQAWCLARPVTALVVGVLLVALITVALLLMGPPIPAD
ncbi:DUF3817 domain-containing protein [Zhihengliuella sp.]|uniref:DUF3817 domain-containing protein n=1 Tax=Zhihengliuella sp. TaxID=1954483 RepID=UPI0028110337|nr:DUF3817 domain-containing protein [Zhihengliuella sp.]